MMMMMMMMMIMMIIILNEINTLHIFIKYTYCHIHVVQCMLYAV